MIQSRNDYLYYLTEDRKALNKKYYTLLGFFKEYFFPDYILKFQKLLRRTEYYKNCKKNWAGYLHFIILYYRFRRISVKLGFSIPLNVFGPGLAIVHYGTIVVNAGARVGANCRIHPSTCIGASNGESQAPKIGNNVYIAPGVKIYGDIIIGDNVAIAANSVVNRSFIENNMLIGGIPAQKIRKIEITNIIKQINNEDCDSSFQGLV